MFVVLFVDDNSWQAEAKIDMDLFHQVFQRYDPYVRTLLFLSDRTISYLFASFFQNHLIVTVPPFHNQSITSPVSVGIFVMTNAGRSHEGQTFTFIPDSGTDAVSDTVIKVSRISFFTML